MVLNHTAKEHAWAAKAARRGRGGSADYYLMFDDDTAAEAATSGP
jgi:amylosucrase